MSNNTELMDFESAQSSEDSKSGTNPINIKRLAFRALKYWYLVLLSILIGLSTAYIINRYTTRIYTVKASIIIKESQENVEGKLLYNNVLVDPYRNFYNELYIIKSMPLIKSVVENLNFTTALIREGDLKEKEYYDPDFPVGIYFSAHEGVPKGKLVTMTITDQEHYSVRVINEGELSNPRDGISFGDTVAINGYRLVVAKKGSTILNKHINREYVIMLSDSEKLANRYINRLKASWLELNSSVVNLEINGPVPSKEIDFLNELISQYQQYDLDKKNQAASRTIEFIDSQLKEITDSLRFFEGQVEAFKQKNVITDIDGEALRLYQRVENLETSKAQLRLQRNYYQYLTDYLQKDDNLDQVVPPSSVGVEDVIMTDLISQLVQLQTEVKLQSRTDKVESPFVLRKMEQITKIRSDLLESVKNTLEAQKINEDFLEEQIGLVEGQLRKLPESERRLINIQRNYALSENLYIFLMQKRAEAGISKASTTSDIIVVNPPRRVGGVITPKPAKNYAAGGGIGLILPLLIFALLELFNNKIQAKEDIERVTDIPIIGGVGHNSSRNNLVVSTEPKSSVSESFRTLRSNLNFFTQGKEKRIFMVTSSISGEGKTFTTINLASVLALSDKRVLIVGADMRRPRLFNDFGLNNERGLSDYLS
ncbi:MAG: capsular biosynthesis protein, partial [Bacteroidota bacterium]